MLSKHHGAQLPQAYRPCLSPSLGAPSPALQVKKLKPREVKQFGSSHTAAKDPESVGPDSCGLTARPPLSRALHTHSLLSGKPTATAFKVPPWQGSAPSTGDLRHKAVRSSVRAGLWLPWSLPRAWHIVGAQEVVAGCEFCAGFSDHLSPSSFPLKVPERSPEVTMTGEKAALCNYPSGLCPGPPGAGLSRVGRAGHSWGFTKTVPLSSPTLCNRLHLKR